MAQLNTGKTWGSGETVTAALLNQMVNDATIRSGLVTEQTLNSSPATGDQFLTVTAAGVVYRTTLQNVSDQALFNANRLQSSTVSSASPADTNVLVFNGTQWEPSGVVVQDNGVTTAKITDANVTAAKLATDSVTTDKITDGNVTRSKLASDIRLVPAGAIMAYGGTSAPSGWLLCDGSNQSRTTYSDLWNAIQTSYGSGDGSTTFGLPDLRGRVPVGVDSGDAFRLSANDALGQSSGADLSTEATVASGTGATVAASGTRMPPYQIVNYIIKH